MHRGCPQCSTSWGDPTTDNPSSKDFVRLVTADQLEAPAYFAYDAVLNRRERPTLERTLEWVLKPLALDGVLRLRNAKAPFGSIRCHALAARVAWGHGSKQMAVDM